MRHGEFYDLWVPYWNHYAAHGLWHHNSGPRGTWESAGPSERPDCDTRALNTGAPPTRRRWRDGRRSDEKFLNLRAEMWWSLRERFEKTYEAANGLAEHPAAELVSIPRDRELVAQLSSVLAQHSANGKIKVESKKDMRARGVSSPDRADAVVLAFFEGGGSVYETRGLRFLGEGEPAHEPQPAAEPAGAAAAPADDDRLWG